MDQIKFQKEYLEKIQIVIDAVMESKKSNFYLKKYQQSHPEGIKISSYEDFSKIPLLGKDELLKVEINERNYAKEKDILCYSFSSGTTNQNRPLAIPVSSESPTNERMKEMKHLAGKGFRKWLFLLSPMHGMINPKKTINTQGIVPIMGDIGNLPRTALISKTVGIDAIFSTPTALKFLIKNLENEDFDFKSIKMISLGGEWCTDKTRDYIQRKFSKSKIEIRYGSSEISFDRGYQCKNMYNGPTNNFHLLENQHFIEIIDGEIVHTDLDPKRAFPLIRYRTGDYGTIEEKECPCGNKTLLTMSSTENKDFIKAGGVIIRRELIEKSLSKAVPCPNIEYTTHVYEENTGNQFRIKLVIEIYNLKKSNKLNVGMIKEIISNDLLVTPSKSVGKMVELGFFEPLEIILSDKDKESIDKNQRLVSHL